MAPSPTPPQPNTATLSPRPTPPVLTAAPIPAMTPQPSKPATAADAAGSTFVHWPAATRVASAKAPIPSAADNSGAVLQGHLLGGVVGVEADIRPAPQARAALPADRSPVEDDEVARGHIGDSLADLLHHARCFVAQEERKVVAYPPFAVVKIRVAYATGLNSDDGLPRTRIGNYDVLHSDGFTHRH